MIKFENTEVMGWEAAIRGMRNPMNSWEKSDTKWHTHFWDDRTLTTERKFMSDSELVIGPNDLDLMRRLAVGGPVHAKYRRMITVYVDITAPLYWWKEFDTYKVGTVANSCSTMHKIADKEFTLEDFSCERLLDKEDDMLWCAQNIFDEVIMGLNHYRKKYIQTEEKKYWWQMIQLLPNSYNQRRTVMLNYEVLANIYKSRRNHKLDEWAEHDKVNITYDGEVVRTIPNQYQGFCDWIKTLPYHEIITQEEALMPAE